MAGRIHEDRFDPANEDDGTLRITVEQPTRETHAPYVCVEGNVALSAREARELIARLHLAVRVAERHAQTFGQVVA